MMSDESGERHDMTDAEWEILRQVLPTGRPGPVRRNDRQVMDGIFYILRSGAPWRDLPSRYGPRTINRYNDGARTGPGRRLPGFNGFLLRATRRAAVKER